MNGNGIKKIEEGAYFVVDTSSYFNQISPFDLMLATQTISALPREVVVVDLPDEKEGS